MKFLNYILNRLKERSTWLGLVPLLGLVGISLNPEQAGAIVTAGVALVGALLTFLPDPK